MSFFSLTRACDSPSSMPDRVRPTMYKNAHSYYGVIGLFFSLSFVLIAPILDFIAHKYSLMTPPQVSSPEPGHGISPQRAEMTPLPIALLSALLGMSYITLFQGSTVGCLPLITPSFHYIILILSSLLAKGNVKCK